MVVDEAVAESLRGGKRIRLAVFVASCTERMAQLFTGLRGVDPVRAEDVDLYLTILEELWSLDLPDKAFSTRMEALQGFVELQPSEEELVDVGDIYAFYGVLCMRYAVLYRACGDVEDTVRCAHAALTALGQLDRNIPHSAFFEGEGEFQRRAMLVDTDTERSLLQLRDDDRAASRERLLAVNSRLQK
ncbi:hypothetical protein I3F60_17300 [Streptomyces sp. MUM 136J]|uniref:hypothetical protein n=1 Tax=Streptomyces sp. MUM 136J TaxID=2791992 RepID=UPI001F03F64B|nr:hypothetical protein [Streptomyces sp. MUM 136J]MCH0570991.1 hypothetical protein [Streptomyces sp. MUM 136J]